MAAHDWRLDGETAIQSLIGGPKLTWGGEPVQSKLGRNRLHFDLTPSNGSNGYDEVERMLALGASRLAAGCADGEGLADPGGSEFCVVT